MTIALTQSQFLPDAGGQSAFPDGYIQTLVSGAAVTVTDTTPLFTLPYMTASGKVKLVVNLSALAGGTSPTLTVNYQESADATTYNPTAALTSGALSATGVVWSAVASGPVCSQGRLQFAVGGTGSPTFTVSVYLVAWNR